MEDSLLSPNGIRAVLFDLDGTLRENRPSSTSTFLDYAIQLGLEDDFNRRRIATRWTHYYWAQSIELEEDLNSYPDKEEFWINYSRLHLIAFGCPPGRAADLASRIHDYMRDSYQPQDWVPADVPETLAALRDAGFRLAVLSNRTNPCHTYLDDLGLLSYLEFALVAGEVDYWKPNPGIFQHALQKLNLGPDQVIYVGDNYYADVIGSRSAGMRPVLIDPENLFPDANCEKIQTLAELRDLLGSIHHGTDTTTLP